ncbi:MAG: hypothetical protein DI535_24940 [Citrobacter freundii]|nr:MAG: hypothetical protein DI535_24940 [Citrobacter freundii]
MKKWVISSTIIGILFLLYAIAAAGAGHGSLVPATILTPFIGILLNGGIGSDVEILLLYIVPSITLYSVYGWLIWKFSEKRAFVIVAILVFHGLLVWGSCWLQVSK